MLRDKLFRIASLLTILFPIFLLREAWSDIALCAIALLFLLHSFDSKNWHWCREAWIKTLMLLWCFMLARSLFAAHPADALKHSAPFIRYIVFAAALGRWTLQDINTRQRFLWVLAGFIGLCALDGLLQYTVGYDILRHPLIHDPNAGHIRLDGPFTKPILGIMLAWLAFPIVLPLLPVAGEWKCSKKTVSALGAIVLIMLVIALSGERMALLLTLMGWCIAAGMLKLKKRIIYLGFILVVVFLGSISLLAPALFQRQVTSTVETLTHWQQSPYGILLHSDLTLATQHPVIGVGTDNYRASCAALYGGDEQRNTLCNTHPHNIYLQWLIEEGCIGLGLFMLFVAIILRDAGIALRQARADAVLAGWLIAFIIRVWPFMSTTGFFSRWGAPPFWLVLGALLVYTGSKGAKNAGASLSFQNAGF